MNDDNDDNCDDDNKGHFMGGRRNHWLKREEQKGELENSQDLSMFLPLFALRLGYWKKITFCS